MEELNSVFFSVSDGYVVCNINDEDFLCEDVEDLVVCLKSNNITTANSDIYCSSSIDFCEEDGMEAGTADALIDDALEELAV